MTEKTELSSDSPKQNKLRGALQAGAGFASGLLTCSFLGPLGVLVAVGAAAGGFYSGYREKTAGESASMMAAGGAAALGLAVAGGLGVAGVLVVGALCAAGASVSKAANASYKKSNNNSNFFSQKERNNAEGAVGARVV